MIIYGILLNLRIFLYDEKLNRRKKITIIGVIINGLFILNLLNDNLTFTKNILLNLIESMKRKQMKIYGLN